LIGLDGLEVSGNISVNINETGQQIDEIIEVPNPLYDPDVQGTDEMISVGVQFDQGHVMNIAGDLEFRVADVFVLYGSVDFTKNHQAPSFWIFLRFPLVLKLMAKIC
jgi:hypothetical protein